MYVHHDPTWLDWLFGTFVVVLWNFGPALVRDGRRAIRRAVLGGEVRLAAPGTERRGLVVFIRVVAEGIVAHRAPPSLVGATITASGTARFATGPRAFRVRTGLDTAPPAVIS